MIKAILTKVESNHNRLRTDKIEGQMRDLPSKGERFVFFGEGIEFGVRVISTSEVLEILSKSSDFVEFKTANSHYKLEIL